MKTELIVLAGLLVPALVILSAAVGLQVSFAQVAGLLIWLGFISWGLAC